MGIWIEINFHQAINFLLKTFSSFKPLKRIVISSLYPSHFLSSTAFRSHCCFYYYYYYATVIVICKLRALIVEKLGAFSKNLDKRRWKSFWRKWMEWKELWKFLARDVQSLSAWLIISCMRGRWMPFPTSSAFPLSLPPSHFFANSTFSPHT